MKKILTLIVLGIVITATAIGAYLYAQNEIEIPDETVITAIKAQFPIEKTGYTLGTIKLTQPNIHFENNVIIIETAYEFTDAAQSERIQAQATITSDVDYRRGNLYFYNFALKELRQNGQTIAEDKYAEILFSSHIAYELHYKKPLLYLGNIKSIENTDAIKGVSIKNNQVVIEKKSMKLW